MAWAVCLSTMSATNHGHIPEAPRSKVVFHNTSSLNHHPYSSEEHMVEFSTGQRCEINTVFTLDTAFLARNFWSSVPCWNHDIGLV